MNPIATILIKRIQIVIGMCICFFAVSAYKDYQHKKEEVKRLSENVSQANKSEATGYLNQSLNTKEMKEYFQYKDSVMYKKLADERIRIDRILKYVSNVHKYRDTINRTTVIDTVLIAIKNNQYAYQDFTDSTECLKIKGAVIYDKEKLSVRILDRQYNNTTNAVVYSQRKQWSFLGIKTRFLGKKEFTAKIFDNCGETKIINIEKHE